MRRQTLNPDVPWQEALKQLTTPTGGKNLLIVRYGAFGDILMMSSILPQLKVDGWHITVNCSERGLDILRTDPNVDEVILQATDQVPVLELDDYWSNLAEPYDKFVNLSESVEGKLLALGPRLVKMDGEMHPVQGREEFYWPHEKRCLLLNRNYVEEAHKISGIPFEKNRTAFHPTHAETKWAQRFVEKFKRQAKVKKVALWCLSGSSTHKAYTFTDYAIMDTFNRSKDWGFILVGDIACRILEQGWEQEKRVACKSARWPIRKVLAMAKTQVNAVLGPETGVLNSVSMEPVKKIIHLSHSSEENLTRDWVNTTVVTPIETPCFPCHQLHSVPCPHIDTETKQSQCAVNIHWTVFSDALLGESSTPGVIIE